MLKYLEKQKEPKSRGEIALGLGESPTKVSRALAILLKYSEIKCVEINRVEARRRFGACRRMWIYYV